MREVIKFYVTVRYALSEKFALKTPNVLIKYVVYRQSTAPSSKINEKKTFLQNLQTFKLTSKFVEDEVCKKKNFKIILNEILTKNAKNGLKSTFLSFI